jgi:hypothetical protein
VYKMAQQLLDETNPKENKNSEEKKDWFDAP